MTVRIVVNDFRLMNFNLLFLYIIIIFAWFITGHQSHTMYTSSAQIKSQSKEMNNRETNENMHSNSTLAICK